MIRFARVAVIWIAALVCVASLSGCPESRLFLTNGCVTQVEGQGLGQVAQSGFSIDNTNEDDKDYMIKIPEATARKYKFFRAFSDFLATDIRLEAIPYSGSGELAITGSLTDNASSSRTRIDTFRVAPMEPITSNTEDTIIVCTTIDNQPVMQTISISARYVGLDFIEDVNSVLQALAGVTNANAIVANRFGLETGKVRELSFGDQSPRAATGPESIVASTTGQAPLPPEPAPQKQFNGFPCGAGPNGFTVCPSMPAARPVVGDAYYVSMVLEEDVVLDDPEYFYTYAFVFDGNNFTGDNWQALPQFPNDFFQGTDHWYQVQYSPDTGQWTLIFQLARNGAIAEFATYAHAVISGNSITLVVPSGDFNVAEPNYRLTAFRHPGDFGEDGDWEADIDPDINTPLLPFFPLHADDVPFEE